MVISIRLCFTSTIGNSFSAYYHDKSRWLALMVLFPPQIKQILPNHRLLILKMEKYKKFYEDIGYEPYQEIRVMVGSNWYSYYPKNFSQTMSILQKFSEHNCYVGVNPRKNKGGSGEDVAYRRMMVFDVERIDYKPSLSDEVYKKDLHKGIEIIRKVVNKFTGGDVTYIVSSGRGIHLYYKLEKVDTSYQPEYNYFYNFLIKKINKELEKLNLKTDPPVKDLPRVFGCPGTQNVKYEESSAFRQILSYEDNIVSIQKQLDKIKEKNKVRYGDVKRNRRSVDFIRKSPEYQIFKYKPPKGTGINNYLRLALKLLMRESDLTRDEVNMISEEIRGFGYQKKDMWLGESYLNLVYSHNIIQKYCWNNWEWCVDVKFPFPYFKDDTSTGVTASSKIIEYEHHKKVKNYDDFIEFIICYNKKTLDLDNAIVYPKGMMYSLEQSCDWKFWEFIENNGKNLVFMYMLLIDDPKDDISEFLVV